MARLALSNNFWKLTLLVLSVLLFVSMIIIPVHADVDPAREKRIQLSAGVRTHMDKMRQEVKVRGQRTSLKMRHITDQEVNEIEEKLRTGGMRPHEACSQCHLSGETGHRGRPLK